jgi:hypothetical protein
MNAKKTKWTLDINAAVVADDKVSARDLAILPKGYCTRPSTTSCMMNSGGKKSTCWAPKLLSDDQKNMQLKQVRIQEVSSLAFLAAQR